MSIALQWRVREPPLRAVAVVAAGAAVAALARRTAEAVAGGTQLYACAVDGWLVVLGDVDELPWVDGVRYLGRDAGVLVPTTQECLPDAELVRTAVAAAAGELVAVLPDAVLVGPMPHRRADVRRLPAVPMTKNT